MYSISHLAQDAKPIPLKDIVPNEYNPNVMPFDVMVLLGVCMIKYGFLFPVLVFWNEEKNKFQIIDGYHRWKTLSELSRPSSKLFKAVCTHLGVAKDDIEVNKIATCIVLDISTEEAMQLTVLMNRIKGAHKVQGMSDLVSTLSTMNVEDVEIAKSLGMEGEEFIRLKQQNGEGVANSFRNHKYSKSWEIR